MRFADWVVYVFINVLVLDNVSPHTEAILQGQIRLRWREPSRRAKVRCRLLYPTRKQSQPALFCITPALKELLYNHSMKRVFTIPSVRESQYCVPRRLHFIWLGGPVPEALLGNLRTFVVHLGSSYEIYLWGNNRATGLNVPAGVQYCSIPDYNFTTEHLRSTVSSLAEQSDILRYEIIFRFGGIYVLAVSSSSGE